jgi:hypothetical protein
MTQNLVAIVQPDESQTSILHQPTKETTGTASPCLEWITREQPEVTGTSN